MEADSWWADSSCNQDLSRDPSIAKLFTDQQSGDCEDRRAVATQELIREGQRFADLNMLLIDHNN